MQELLSNCPIVTSGGNIALPNWAAAIPDYVGAGGTSPGGVVMPFMRPMAGARQVGSVERDAIRNITGFLTYVVAVSGATGRGVFEQSTSDSGGWGSGGVYAKLLLNTNRVVPTGPENTVTNRGMTPVIYLGV